MNIKLIISLCALLPATASWADSQMQPLFHNDYINMTYPSVAGNNLVYSQRVSHRYQIVQLQKNDLSQAAKDVNAMVDKDVVRNGIALANGDIAYVSTRLKGLTPWIQRKHGHSALAPAVFQSGIQPNHFNANADGSFWVFDSTFESTRRMKISNQFSNGRLNNQLLGQAWRMYHDKFWAFKSGYVATETGVTNKFKQPKLFVLQQDGQQLTMFGDGFDADVSDNGKKIVFVREIDGNFDLWLQNMDGSGLKRLTRSKYADLEPSFSADGKRIAFVSNRDSKGDVSQTLIYTLDLETGAMQAVTSGMGVVDGGPDWLDEQTIVFHSNRDSNTPMSDTVDHWSLWTVQIK